MKVLLIIVILLATWNATLTLWLFVLTRMFNYFQGRDPSWDAVRRPEPVNPPVAEPSFDRLF